MDENKNLKDNLEPQDAQETEIVQNAEGKQAKSDNKSEKNAEKKE